MNSNKDFLPTWKPIHQKGILSYVMKKSLPLILSISFVTILFIPRYQKVSADIRYPFVYLLIMSLMSILINIWHWFSGEKRYKKELQLMEMLNKCPACFAKLSPEDKSCPSCGLLLKIDL